MLRCKTACFARCALAGRTDSNHAVAKISHRFQQVFPLGALVSPTSRLRSIASTRRAIHAANQAVDEHVHTPEPPVESVVTVKPLRNSLVMRADQRHLLIPTRTRPLHTATAVAIRLIAHYVAQCKNGRTDNRRCRPSWARLQSTVQ